MKKICNTKKICLLILDNISQREIVKLEKVSFSTISKCKKLISENDFTKEQISNFTKKELNQLINEKVKYETKKALPDVAYIFDSISKKTTIKEMWQKYCDYCNENELESLNYSRFCDYVKEYQDTYRNTNDSNFPFGKILYEQWFPGYITTIDEKTGEKLKGYIFIAIYPFSNYIYLKYCDKKDTYNWVAANIKLFEKMKVVPKKIYAVDNTAINTIKQGNKQLKSLFISFLNHYHIELLQEELNPIILKEIKNIIKDLKCDGAYTKKEWIENLVQISTKLNEVINKDNGPTRKEVFTTVEKPFMQSMSEEKFDYYIEKEAKIQLNYHVEYESVMYSVPYEYSLDNPNVIIRQYNHKLEFLRDGEIIATHSYTNHPEAKYVTIPEHMPNEEESKKMPWNREVILSWANSFGPYTTQAIEKTLNSKRYEQQAYKTCISILSLTQNYPKQRIEEMCKSFILRKEKNLYMFIKENIIQKSANTGKNAR